MASANKKSASLIDEFCSVTGASEDIGSKLLEACNNNLELAVNMHMEGAVAGGSGANTADPDDIRAPIPQTQEVLVDDAPAYAAFNRSKRKNRSVFDGFRDFQEEAPMTRGRLKALGQQEAAIMAGASGSHASRKTRTLQDLFRPPVDLTYKGTFANARETGKKQGRWLMVNVQNVQEFTCQALNRDIWSHSSVKCLIKESFIFWQVYHDSEEGQRYCQFYKVEEWPYVAILDPQTGENLISWNKVDAAPTFCQLVMEFLQQHPALDCLTPSSTSSASGETIIDAPEDDQLQAAITASLTDVGKPRCTATAHTDSESSELETFTDSDDDLRPSPAKVRKILQSNTDSDSSRSRAGSISPALRRSPRRHSTDSDSSPKRSDMYTSPKRRRTREVSPLVTTDNSSSDKHSASPVKVTQNRGKSQSPVRSSPKSATTSPKKKPSVHNDIHPAVAEKMRRHSVSEDVQVAETSSGSAPQRAGCSKSSEQETSDLDISTEEERKECMKYKNYLGPDSEEKTTLMLRLPDGQRERMCIAYSSTLRAVVMFVGSKGFSDKSYELITQFPRRQLSQLKYDDTLKDIGLHSQETIFVQAKTADH